MSSVSPSPAWFRLHFNDDYLVLYSGRSRDQARDEVEFIRRELRLERTSSVLDLCCGFGRHLEALQELGIPAFGADLSKSLLSVARSRLDEIARDKRGDPVAPSELVCCDMRRLPFEAGSVERGFDAVVSFFTSFGYFEEPDEHLRVATEIARVLRPGGRYSLDLMNANSAIRDLVPVSTRDAGPYHVEERRSYDAARKRIEKTIHLANHDTGAEKSYFESVRVFTLEEVSALLSAAGLVVDRVFGDFSGATFGQSSPRMILCGRRPEV